MEKFMKKSKCINKLNQNDRSHWFSVHCLVRQMILFHSFDYPIMTSHVLHFVATDNLTVTKTILCQLVLLFVQAY